MMWLILRILSVCWCINLADMCQGNYEDCSTDSDCCAGRVCEYTGPKVGNVCLEPRLKVYNPQTMAYLLSERRSKSKSNRKPVVPPRKNFQQQQQQQSQQVITKPFDLFNPWVYYGQYPQQTDYFGVNYPQTLQGNYGQQWSSQQADFGYQQFPDQGPYQQAQSYYMSTNGQDDYGQLPDHQPLQYYQDPYMNEEQQPSQHLSRSQSVQQWTDENGNTVTKQTVQYTNPLSRGVLFGG